MRNDKTHKRDFKTDKSSFAVYKNWESILSEVGSDEEIGQLFRALFAFAKRGERPIFKNGAARVAFNIMSNAIQTDGERWEDICEKRSEAANKRWNKHNGEPQAEPSGDFEDMPPSEPGTQSEEHSEDENSPKDAKRENQLKNLGF